MGRNDEREYPQKKISYFERMNEYLDAYDKIVICGVDNITSAQIHKTRIDLRGKAIMLLGKNTMMKKVLNQRREKSERDEILYQRLVSDRMLQGNVGLLFTNGDLNEIKDVLDANRKQAPARQGSIAPIDVTVPAGNTGLEPTKTSFFQALNIPTKITKGTVEILKDQQVITAGEKVGSSEAALLQMLNIKPFYYAIGIENIYDQGSFYGAWVLSITDEKLTELFSAGVRDVTAFSLGVGQPTKPSFPHAITDAFKNILAISVETDYTFEEFNGEKLKDAILNGPDEATLAAAAAASAGPAAAAEEKKEEEEDSDEEMGFGLFD
eukprot:NODE_826_length_1165_cov_463.102119_g784_i0.p1 GENE.NODE_826_length_1165_cov_463.102119_g784_i0~~NODE_826_length_1165_cov_463.102119_g784_i0.p1  ORF type:complete len:324 (+),score=108.48 NODE_826_length_1165_cov_463.102119_g784_i0:112-1083(+)